MDGRLPEWQAEQRSGGHRSLGIRKKVSNSGADVVMHLLLLPINRAFQPERDLARSRRHNTETYPLDSGVTHFLFPPADFSCFSKSSSLQQS
jgi:hypothetical protein